MARKRSRTSQALRDVLFDEIDELRSGKGDPQRATAVANLARQIIAVAKVELDFHREAAKQAEDGRAITMGSMALGSTNASSAGTTTTEPPRAPSVVEHDPYQSPDTRNFATPAN